MSRLARLLMVVAALLLAVPFAAPLWRISLIAPQYPEGLGMYVRINTVEGVTEHDLTNINELNHYIGMKLIDASAIPELRFMPWVLGALIAGALLVALVGRKRLLYAWSALFAVAAALGLWDFWRWNYDYGHNLDYEHAIIKVPGMVYQPPVIGSKQILNFTATSWPSAGGLAAFAAGALVAVAVVLTIRRARAAHAAPLAHAA